MKLTRVLLSSAAVLVMAGAAHAADLVVDVPVSSAPVAVAGTGWYLSVFGGGQWANSIEGDDGNASNGQFFDYDSDAGWLIGAAVGTHFTDNLRGEIEVSTGSVDLTSVTVTGGLVPGDNFTAPITDGTGTTTYLLANLWFDLDTGSGFTPYIGGGLGAGYITVDGTIPTVATIDLSGWGWAYQVGAGVKFDVADNIALDLGYRFKSIVDADLTGGGNDAVANVSSHVLQAGLTFGF